MIITVTSASRLTMLKVCGLLTLWSGAWLLPLVWLDALPKSDPPPAPQHMGIVLWGVVTWGAFGLAIVAAAAREVPVRYPGLGTGTLFIAGFALAFIWRAL